MKDGWLNTIGTLAKPRNLTDILNENFPDLPKVGFADLNRHIRLIGNFYKYKEGEKSMRFSSKAFRERLEDGDDHIFTMNGYIDFLKNGIEIDIMLGYKMYLEAEIPKITADLTEYFYKIMESKEKYTDEAIKAICSYMTLIENYSNELVETEMKSVRARLGIEEKLTTETLHNKIKRGIMSILPA